MLSPTETLALMLRTDPAAPRITCYDDRQGPTRGERVELSARVLGTWVAKAANALQEEWDLGPGSRVRVDLAAHWRTLYWALATWSVGAAVVIGGDEAADLVITDEPQHLPTPPTPAVFVTAAALARSAGIDLPADTLDEAAEVATYGDQFDAWDEPSGDDLALQAGERTTYAGLPATLARHASAARGRIAVIDPDPLDLIATAVTTWAAGGSLVLHLGDPSAETLSRRNASEGVTEVSA
ncbi:TIGR03089 family protein [Janibacter sp. GXQ6167]|uniref:TIGR03089 family protein n=1 Tax=Janibacter sp. GXQ6167 TaxID=3240791 RepID=UPI003523F896